MENPFKASNFDLMKLRHIYESISAMYGEFKKRVVPYILKQQCLFQLVTHVMNGQPNSLLPRKVSGMIICANYDSDEELEQGWPYTDPVS